MEDRLQNYNEPSSIFAIFFVKNLRKEGRWNRFE
jgi:hypothetical protein